LTQKAVEEITLVKGFAEPEEAAMQVDEERARMVWDGAVS
jgi:hypothetical protein